MTVQEAIKELQVGYLGDTEELVQAKHIGIKALEKQIPKKPHVFKDEYGEQYFCPICDYSVDDDGRGYEQPYCLNCGQKIDWEEGEC